jgi:excisionase family DNA binding protein
MTNSEHHAQLLAGFAGFGARLSYTPAQAAAVTGRSRSRIFKAIKDGELQALKDGKATLLTDVELRRWLGSLPTIGREPQSA